MSNQVPEFVAGQLLAVVKNGVSNTAVETSIKEVDGKLLKTITAPTMTTVLIEVDKETIHDSLKKLANDPNFTAVQLNHIAHLS